MDKNREEDFLLTVGNEGELELLDGVVTGARVSWTVNTFEPYKYPDSDGVFPAM